MALTTREQEVVLNTDFLLLKAKVLEKSWQLLEKVRDEIRVNWDEANYVFPDGLVLHSGKISKGENYRLLPYQILDYPALFQRENVFAFRTMFWWGHHFSFTFHLQGNFLEEYRERVIKAWPFLVEQDLFVCVGDTPWQYHYESDNYSSIEMTSIDFIHTCDFLKISKRVELTDWDQIPTLANSFVIMIMSHISGNKVGAGQVTET